jgi:hypothetical protein
MSWDFTIEVIDIHTLSTQALILRSVHCTSISEALVLNGYLGTSPESPTTAVSLRTLELYAKIHTCKPSFSVEAFAKFICDFYMVSKQRSFTCVY